MRAVDPYVSAILKFVCILREGFVAAELPQSGVQKDLVPIRLNMRQILKIDLSELAICFHKDRRCLSVCLLRRTLQGFF